MEITVDRHFRNSYIIARALHGHSCLNLNNTKIWSPIHNKSIGSWGIDDWTIISASFTGGREGGDEPLVITVKETELHQIWRDHRSVI